MDVKKLIENLSHRDAEERLDALRGLMQAVDIGLIPRPVTGTDVNNHIHTTYSFSPYTPANAVWTAYNAGLATAGIMDHDSVAGILEFHEAGSIAGIATTGGVELRVDFSDTPVNNRRINNPDQDTIVYMALHGIPIQSIGIVERYLKPLREQRNLRNIKMTSRLNEIFAPHSIELDFESDVLPLSSYAAGGSVTERHLLFALAKKLIAKYGTQSDLTDFLEAKIGLEINDKVRGWLTQSDNPNCEYDLLGLLKSSLVSRFYIDADAGECPDVRDVVALATRAGAISAYAYLGDVGDSVTGDKRAQRFEDSYLDLLFDSLVRIGFNAVTYMPSRNTKAQLDRIRALCEKSDLFQISGEDINSPRQSFVCEAARAPEFSNLIDSTWALIGHEKAAKRGLDKGMFSYKTKAAYPDLETRIKRYTGIAEL